MFTKKESITNLSTILFFSGNMAEENEKTPDNATPSGSSVNNPSPLKVLAQQKAKKSVTKTEKPEEETSKNPNTADSEQSSSSRPRAETIEQRRRNAKVINWLSDHGKVPAASPMAPDQVWPLTQFFLFPFCENSLICLEGKSMSFHEKETEKN